jgi:NAD(P)H-hydrate epimerase
MGAGYVMWGAHEAPHAELKQIPEVLTVDVKDPALWVHPKITAAAIGPGLGVGEKTAHLIERLKSTRWPVIVDADAITTCVQFDLFPLPAHWVLTPHAGELSRVLKISSAEIEADRFGAARAAAARTGAQVLLKGYRSVLAHADRVMVINSGNSALAKAGTGDVLTGMMAGLLAQGVDVVQGVGAAAYIHGKLADEWVRSGHDRRSLSASDLKDHLPELLSRIAKSGLD